MNSTSESLPVIRTVDKTIRVRAWEYPMARVVALLPDDPSELRRAFATSLAMGSEGQAVYVTVKVKDPVTTQFVNLSFRMDSCQAQRPVAGHQLEIISGELTDGTGSRAELSFVDGEIRLVTLVVTEVLTYEDGERS